MIISDPENLFGLPCRRKTYLAFIDARLMGSKTNSSWIYLVAEDTIDMPVENVDEAIHLIEKWMDGRGFTISPPREKDESTVEFNFAYNGKTERGLGFTVVQPKNIARLVLVASRIDIAGQHRDILGSMETSEFEDFMWELKRALVLAPASFQILPPEGMPDSIQLSLEISFDELSEGKLNNALNSISKSAVLIILLFSKMGV
ncbi:MAG TPA: DUF2299 family protein [Methanothrix sp.]|nr:DUF2299 family protein [Methanothrix sp.]